MNLYFSTSAFIAISVSLISGILYAAVLYYLKDKLNSFLSARQKQIAAFLRFLAVFLITLFLFQPKIKHTYKEINKPVIIFAQDNSESIISVKDSTYYKTEYPKKIKTTLQQIANEKNAELKFVTFGTTPSENDSITFSEKITNFDKLFNFISNSYKNENVKLLIVASDGIMNNGENRIYNDYPVTFKTDFLLLGDTTIYPDASVKNLEYNNLALQNSIIPVKAVIQANKFKGKTLTVSLTEKNKPVKSIKVKPADDNFITTIDFKISPETKGIHTYNISIETGVDEKNKINNTATFKIEVIEANQRILLLGNAPHPDLGAIKTALSTNLNFKTDLKFADNFNGDIDNYNLIILHNLPSAHHKITNLISKIHKRGIPVLFILGTQTDLNAANRLNLPVRINSTQHIFEDAYPVASTSFESFTIDNLQDNLDNFPPLKSFFAEYKITPSSEVFLYQKIKNIKTNKPLIAFSLQDNVKTGVITGENIWRWRIYDNFYNGNNDFFNSLINNIASYLSIKKKKENLNVFVKKLIKQYEPVIFNAQFFNEIYQPVNNPDLNLEIKNKKTGETEGFVFDRTTAGYKLEINSLMPGDYEYTAKLKYKNKTYTQKGTFSIEKVNLEQINTIANPGFLAKLAEKFDGKLFFNQDSLFSSIRDYDFVKPEIKFTKGTDPLTHFKFLLIAIVLLLSLEWLLRKLWGTI